MARVRPAAVRARSAARTGSFHLVSSVIALIFLMPLLWTVLNSIKSSAEANQQPPTWFPKSFSLENYAKLAQYGEGIGVYLVNSIVLSLLTVVITVAISVLAGYGFARYTFAGKRLLFGTTLVVLMVPYASILIPLYIVMGKLGLTNSVFGLALVLVMFQLPFGVFLMRNSFESIPRELEEAGWVDGASTLKTLRYIALPLIVPGMVTVGLFTFIASWNEYLAPLIFLNDGSQFTLPLLLVSVRSNSFGVVDFGALQAGIVIAILPVLLVYVLLQRYYVSGLINGALRG